MALLKSRCRPCCPEPCRCLCFWLVSTSHGPLSLCTFRKRSVLLRSRCLPFTEMHACAHPAMKPSPPKARHGGRCASLVGWDRFAAQQVAQSRVRPARTA